jgi:hypothetical protein
MSSLPYYRSLQIAAIFEIFTVSLLGFFIPIALILRSRSTTCTAESILDADFFKIGRAFSTGIILGLAIMHLLVEAAEVELLRNGYPCT